MDPSHFIRNLMVSETINNYWLFKHIQTIFFITGLTIIDVNTEYRYIFLHNTETTFCIYTFKLRGSPRVMGMCTLC